MIAVTNSIPNLKSKLNAKKMAFSSIHNTFGGNLRLLISGGSAATADTVKGFRDLGISVLQGYGITECSPVIALNRDTCFKDDSVGLCTPNALLDIADMEEDGVGEIRYRGEGVMVGYYRRPELTREVIHDGWFYTGDMGYLDADGFFVQEYTINILPAIYPDGSLSKIEAKEAMKKENYEAWVRVYEEFYQKPLVYGEI